MKEFYQDIIVQKSWQALISLKKNIEFVLIGGWAVYLYTKALKSKDIDMIVDYSQLQKLRKDFPIFKNDRLKKYEVKTEGIDIDIYLPHYSDLGVGVEEIIKNKQTKDAFNVPAKEMLVLTKLYAYNARRASVKGQKDKIDIISLVFMENFDFSYFQRITCQYQKRGFKELLINILRETREVKELNLNKHFFAKKKKEILGSRIRKN